MSDLICLLGAYGDIAIMLPWMKMESERIGKPVPVLVAERYASIFEGTSYVQPVPCPADFQDVLKAVRWLRSELPEQSVRVLQYCGRHHETALPSFADEQWWLAGAWKGWQDRPLVFDRRDFERERELCLKVTASKPLILVGTKGRSSPFPHSAQLMRRIRREFGKTHEIVNLDKIKAHRIYDLLGLYECAEAIISIDTAHLHLSRAALDVPVFALCRDYPTRWHGTPHQERFAFHCRYGDYLKREDEMMVALRETLEGRASKIKLTQCAPKGHYNPAIRQNGECIEVATRQPYAGDWRTRLHWTIGGFTGDIRLPRAWAQHSHEDLRFFDHKDGLWAALTLSVAKNRRMPKCVTGYGRMLHDSSIPKLFIPKFGQNDFSGMEKNWVFFSYGGKVHAVYSCDPEHVVLELDGEEVVKQYNTLGPRWEYGEIRGGTPPVPYRDDTWLRFFHSRIWDRKPRRKPRNKTERIFHPADPIPWRYYVGAMVMESAPPFRVLKVSASPILTGTEQWVPGCPHWKPNVVIPYGCVPQENGWTVSLGVNDALSCLATLTEDQLKLS